MGSVGKATKHASLMEPQYRQWQLNPYYITWIWKLVFCLNSGRQGKHTGNFLFISLFSSLFPPLLPPSPFPLSLSFSFHLRLFCQTFGSTPWESCSPFLATGGGLGQPALTSTLVYSSGNAAQSVLQSCASSMETKLITVQYSKACLTSPVLGVVSQIYCRAWTPQLALTMHCWHFSGPAQQE